MYYTQAIWGDRVTMEQSDSDETSALNTAKQWLAWERRYGEADTVRVIWEGELVFQEKV